MRLRQVARAVTVVIAVVSCNVRCTGHGAGDSATIKEVSSNSLMLAGQLILHYGLPAVDGRHLGHEVSGVNPLRRRMRQWPGDAEPALPVFLGGVLAIEGDGASRFHPGMSGIEAVSAKTSPAATTSPSCSSSPKTKNCMTTKITLLALLIGLAAPSRSHGAGTGNAHWPQFRGPHAAGVSANANLPDQWSATENVAWKTDLPGRSWSSPIVWGERVFVTAVVNSGESEPP